VPATWTLRDFLRARGIRARVLRYRPGPVRRDYHFNQGQLLPHDVQWQLVLRYPGRFAGCCLYHSTDGRRPSAGEVLADSVRHYLFAGSWCVQDGPEAAFRCDTESRRCERIGGRLRAFLGAGWWELVNAYEDGLLR
jgi:hypothetical protein